MTSRGLRTNKETGAFRKAVPFRLGHVLSLVSHKLVPHALIVTIVGKGIGVSSRGIRCSIHGMSRGILPSGRWRRKTANSIRGSTRGTSSNVRGRVTGCWHRLSSRGSLGSWKLRGVRLCSGVVVWDWRSWRERRRRWQGGRCRFTSRSGWQVGADGVWFIVGAGLRRLGS